MLRILIVLFLASSAVSIKASIFCPTDRDVWCSDDLDDLDFTGVPTLLGTDAWYTPKYIDTSYLSTCREGIVERTWFVDYNDDDVVSPHEPVCKQILTVLKEHFDTFLEFPEDITVNCIVDIVKVPPTIQTGPCEHVGYEIKVEEITFVEDACLKVHHNYEVINWCHHDPSNPDPSSYWTHTRVIKVVDKTAPQISSCTDEVFEVEGDCAVLVELSISAEDLGDCPSGELNWYATVDLWADGTDDLNYGPNETGIFKLDPEANGESVSIAFPERYGESKHKVKWVVSDGCHNFATCSKEISIADIKKPTPYCRTFLTFAFDGSHGPLEVPVELFAIDGSDNCTNSEELQFSFSSNVEDKVQQIECGEEGFKFYRIYVTDEAGNQDYCEVFALVADNGSCDGTFRPEGSITMLDGSTPELPIMHILDGEELISSIESDPLGDYVFDDIQIMETYSSKIEEQIGQSELVDISDLILLQKHILGLDVLESYPLVAADLDRDGEVRVSDLYIMRDHILDNSQWQSDLIYAPVYGEESTMIADEISLSNYHDGFNFYAFHRGNISDLVDGDEAGKIILEASIEEGNLILTNTESIIIDGQLVKSSLLNQSSSKLSVYPEGKKYIPGELEIILEGITSIENIDIDYLKDNINIVLNGNRAISNIEFVNKDLDKSVNNQQLNEEVKSIESIANENLIYPNPSYGSFTIQGGDVSNVAVFTMTGRKLPIKVNNDSENSTVRILSDVRGTLLVKFVLGSEVNYERVVVIND